MENNLLLKKYTASPVFLKYNSSDPEIYDIPGFLEIFKESIKFNFYLSDDNGRRYEIKNIKELADAKTLIAELNGKVSNLFADLTKAQAENKELTSKNEQLTNTNTTLNNNLTATQKEKERLQDIGSTLHASNFGIQSLRVREDGTERKTTNTKRANTIRLTFQIDKNKITPSGSQDLYVCITSPDGKAFNEVGKINTREEGAKA